MKVLKVGVTVVIATITVSFMTTSIDAGQGTSKDAVAQKLVNECAKVQENELVMITGGVRDLELLEDMATHVRKVGAFPFVVLNSDRLNRRYFDEVPAKYDRQEPKADLKLAEIVTAIINVSYEENPRLLADVSPERFEALTRAYAPVGDLLMKRNVKVVNMGNDLYPTKERAKLFHMTKEQLEDVFWAGIDADYSVLEKRGEDVRRRLAAGKMLHLTNSNGTDLEVEIGGRKVYVTDGVISGEDIKEGGAACQLWLPAGEVYLAPVQGTANGKVVVDRLFYEGKEIQGLELSFEAGKLTTMKADSGLERLKAVYDASGEGKDEFAFIDIGINPSVQIVPDSRMVAWMTSGMVTVGIGANQWAGGENDASFALTTHLPGSTLKVDDQLLVENGVLKPES